MDSVGKWRNFGQQLRIDTIRCTDNDIGYQSTSNLTPIDTNTIVYPYCTNQVYDGGVANWLS